MSRTKTQEITCKEEKKFYKGKIKSQRKEIERLMKKIESLKKQLADKRSIVKEKIVKEKVVKEKTNKINDKNAERKKLIAKLKEKYCTNNKDKNEKNK